MILTWPFEVSVSSSQLEFVQKRRSTRIYNAIPLVINGSDAFNTPYLEEVSTLTINCHGCRYESRYEVIQGDMVFLEVKQPNEGSTTYFRQANVKWVQRLVTKESRFQIAVELAAPGNIWGIVSPPTDWFPIQVAKAIERESTRPEQPLATQIERQEIPTLNEASAHLSHLQRDDPTAALPPSLGQPMAGIGELSRTMFSLTATMDFVKERERLIDEFRTQLQNEATIAHEAWNKKIEQDIKNAAQTIAAQAVEISQRVEGMTVSTLERLGRNMEASRTEAVDRFLSRLREQLAPLLDGAQLTLQNLAIREKKLRDESQGILERFDNFLQQTTQHSIAEVQGKTLGMLDQFESDVTKRLVECHDELHERSVEIIAETIRILSEIPQNCESSVQGQLRSLVSSASDEVIKVLNERTVQIPG